MGYGLTTSHLLDYQELSTKFTKVAQNATMKALLKSQSREMRFAEDRNGKDFLYWTDYVMRFGTDHLNNKVHNLNYVQTWDLDVSALVGLLGLLFVRKLRK